MAALRFWELELQRDFTPDQQLQFFLPLKLLGSGVQSAQHRHAAAFLGSWELCLHDVAKTVGLSSAEAVRARLPDLAQNITTADFFGLRIWGRLRLRLGGLLCEPSAERADVDHDLCA